MIDTTKLNTSVNFSTLKKENEINSKTEFLPKIICKSCSVENPKALFCKCRSVRYCNKTCQKNDWPSHKADCLSKSLIPNNPPPLSPKVVFSSKKIGDLMLPAYSPKEELSWDINLSKIAETMGKIMNEFVDQSTKFVAQKMSENLENQDSFIELSLTEAKEIMRVSMEWSKHKEKNKGKVIQEKVYRLSFNFLIKFLETFSPIKLPIDSLKLDKTLNQLKITSEVFTFNNCEIPGTHKLEKWTPSEEQVLPFGDKDLTNKISNTQFSCDKFAFLTIGEMKAKNWIFDSSQFSKLDQMQQQLSDWGYRPVQIPKKGDLALYFHHDQPVHLGVYLGDGRVKSKHGHYLPFVVKHEIFDVYEEYGRDVVFYRAC